MKKLFFALFSICLLSVAAQSGDANETIYIDKIDIKDYYSMKTEGWVMIKSNNGEQFLSNLSNENYILNFSINCKGISQKPSFLIEYNNNYDDKEWAGLDFASSHSDSFKKIVFIIDKTEFINPFQNYNKASFDKFKTALQKGNILTIKFYNSEFNPNTGKDALQLNRALDFSLKNGHLLDNAVDCADEDTSPVPTTAVTSAAD